MMSDETTRLRALLEQTEMPWRAVDVVDSGTVLGRGTAILRPHSRWLVRRVAEVDMGDGEERDTAHAALIVAAVNALPGLLDAAERAERAERERDDLAATLETRNAEHALAMEQLAAVTAERDAEAAARYLAQKDRDTQVDALGHALATLRDSVLAALGAQPHEDAAEVAHRVIAERDVLRAQQAPLLDAHDALVAAARAAGWTGAGATGEELVAWVRRGEREACAALLETAADEREYAAGRSDDDVDHHDLCTRAKHLRGAAALLRLNTTWLPAKAVRDGGE